MVGVQCDALRRSRPSNTHFRCGLAAGVHVSRAIAMHTSRIRQLSG